MLEQIREAHRLARAKPTLAIAPGVVEGVRRVAVFLGPYRNLTTITASILALHPQCQVLNHAGDRILRRGRFDFIATPDAATLRDFVAMGLRASTGGKRGWFGGSILFAHAFHELALRTAYQSRFGDSLLKSEVRCLAWKESMKVQARLMADPGALAGVAAALPQVCFIAPVRHPLDVVVSSMASGHAALMLDAPNPSFAETTRAVLGAFGWILDQKERFPDRIFVFQQAAIGDGLFRDLARFLELDEDRRWLEDAGRCFVARERTHSEETRVAFRKAAEPSLAKWPQLAAMCR